MKVETRYNYGHHSRNLSLLKVKGCWHCLVRFLLVVPCDLISLCISCLIVFLPGSSGVLMAPGGTFSLSCYSCYFNAKFSMWL